MAEELAEFAELAGFNRSFVYDIIQRRSENFSLDRVSEVLKVDCNWLLHGMGDVYRIGDNKLSELAGWDEALLSKELQELLAKDYDLWPAAGSVDGWLS